VLCAAWAWVPAHAGRPCDTEPPGTAAVLRGLALAETVARRLDSSGAQVVMIARAGQDLSRWGLQWSHLGLAYREAAQAGRPAAWRIVHKLNRCGSDQAAIYRQGLAEFFLDGLHDEKAGIVVPSPAVQARLLAVLRDDARAVALHERRYNMVAYPWAQRYQQSNQWAIETLAASMEPQATSRARAQAWLRLQGYEPTTLRVNAFTRLGARTTTAHIAFDDHPPERRLSDRIDTVTVDSVFEWLARSGLGGPVQVIR
jgi:hypothetical protein